MIQAIVFDFDGVIVDSNKIRKDTYFEIFSHIAESEESIEQGLKENPKETRYGIIQEILKKLQEKDLVQFEDLENERDKYVEKYNEITEDKVSKAEEIKGAEKSLSILCKKYPLFIVTGTIQKSLDVVLENRNLGIYFKKTYGGYASKEEGIKKLLDEHGFDTEKIIFVGDGKADYEAAKQFNMIFVGIINNTNDFDIKEDIKYKLYDLETLPEIIGEIENE